MEGFHLQPWMRNIIINIALEKRKEGIREGGGKEEEKEKEKDKLFGTRF